MDSDSVVHLGDHVVVDINGDKTFCLKMKRGGCGPSFCTLNQECTNTSKVLLRNIIVTFWFNEHTIKRW